MDLRHLDDLVKDSEGGVLEKKQAVTETLAKGGNEDKSTIDSSGALQLFLDHIPVSSFSDVITKNPFSDVEAKTTDNVGNIMHLMRKKGIKRAPIVQNLADVREKKRFAAEYIGLLDLDDMMLWFLQECDKSGGHGKDKGHSEMEAKGFVYMFEQKHPVLQTKVAELAKLFLWDSFFPIHVNDSLFHVLLLLSKHRLQVVPVTEKSDSRILGFVSQNAVIHGLLQASGLEWFDNIADKTLSECRFQNEQVVKIHGDKSTMDALHVLWETRAGSIAVTEPETEKLIGSVRTSDVHLLFEDTDLYSNRKNLKVRDFIQIDAGSGEPVSKTKESAALPPSRTQSFQTSDVPRMISPVTNRKSDTLKEAMKKLANSQSNISFLIDDCDRVQGLITLKDIISQFAPPGIDSRMRGGGFFDFALQETGCHISGGTIQTNR